MIINYGPKKNNNKKLDFIFDTTFDPLKDILYYQSISNILEENFMTYETASANNYCHLEIEENSWVLYIYKTCYLQFKRKKESINIVLVGGGQGGQKGGQTNGAGGAGGDGGFVVKDFLNLEKNQIYEASIGNGGQAWTQSSYATSGDGQAFVVGNGRGETTFWEKYFENNYNNNIDTNRISAAGGGKATPSDARRDYGAGGTTYSQSGKNSSGGDGFSVILLGHEYQYGPGGSSGVSASTGYSYHSDRTWLDGGKGYSNNGVNVYWGGKGGISNAGANETSTAATSGTQNTGGGGGGGGASANGGGQNGATGCSGVIIIYN